MHLQLHTYWIDSEPLTCKSRCPPAFSVSVTGTTIHPWLLPSPPANPSLSPVFSSLWCLNPAMLLCLHCHPLGPCSIPSLLNWTPINDFLSGPLHSLLYLLQPQYPLHLLQSDQTIIHRLKTLCWITGTCTRENKILSVTYKALFHLDPVYAHPASTLKTLTSLLVLPSPWFSFSLCSVPFCLRVFAHTLSSAYFFYCLF